MKDITIAEGSVARQFSGVKRLVTDLTGGGTCAWVPEDEHNVRDKYITRNGTYLPSDDGYNGYGSVTVNVSNAVSGGGAVVGRDTDGNEYEFTVDDGGDVVATKVPSSIAVTTPPTKTSYNEGDPLDFSGIVVTAYDGNGESMGQVPFEELAFVPTVAVPKDGPNYANGLGKVDTGTEYAFYAEQEGSTPARMGYTERSDNPGVYRHSPYYVWIDVERRFLYPDYDMVHCIFLDGNGMQNGIGAVLYNGFTVCSDSVFLGDFRPQANVSLSNAILNSPGQVSGEDAIENARNYVTVQWPAPGGRTLEASYEITVATEGGWSGGGGGTF